MLTILLFTLLFLFLWYYLRDWINYLKTGDPRENNQNYWMFSYDFKDNKNQEMYWEENIQLLNKKKKHTNVLKCCRSMVIDKFLQHTFKCDRAFL